MPRRPRRAAQALLGSVFVSALAAGPADSQIFQPGTQPAGEEGGIVELLGSSESCRECHGDYREQDRQEPWDGWRGSMMGNAARDPVFFAALAIAENDHPDAADFCVRCHSPPAWLRGRSSKPEWSPDDGPRLTPDERAFLSSDRDGVGCVVCHRATDQVVGDPDAPHLQNAQLYFLDGEQAELRVGPYEDTAGVTTMHPVAKSEFLSTSQLCGHCHDIVNPLVMGTRNDGSETGRPFAIERTYSEWLHSVYADPTTPEQNRTCQDCHMKRAELPTRASVDGTARDYFREHALLGGSTWQLRAIAADYPEGTETEAAHLLASAGATQMFLQEAASLEFTELLLDADVVDATVRVTNLTGHKLPTGYPEGRRMWLQLEVLVDGEPVSSTLAPDAAPTDASPTNESDAEQTNSATAPASRTYEAKLGVDGEPSFHFALNNVVLEDTRIPPEGFAPPEELDMSPIGRDYTSQDGSYRHHDDVAHTLYPCATGEAEVRATLWYQSTTREYIEFLRDNAPDSLDPAVENWGARAYALWQEHGGGEPVRMSERIEPLGTLTGLCPTPAVAAESGCSCRTTGNSRSIPALAGLLLLCLLHRRTRLTQLPREP